MKTRQISLRIAKPGMIVGEDIYTASNHLVIVQGTTLTEQIIARLRFYEITSFHIALEPIEGSVAPPIKTESYSASIRKSPEFKKFNTNFVASVDNFKGKLVTILKSEENLDIDDLLEHTNKLVSEARNGIHVFDMLHSLRIFDDTSYVHSINVSLICRIFGGWLKMSKEDIEVLTLCGLLLDVGKLTLPPAVINKIDPLTTEEFALIKTHAMRGYKILKTKQIDERIKYAALMHHERMDGSGYPNKLRGDDIHPFARIVAIADVYDAMTSPRVYRDALCPFDAIRLFEEEGLQKFDPKYIMVFLENIGQSYLGNRVRLNNKKEGEIVLLNKHMLSRPVIKIGDAFIDLSKEQNLYIEAVL